MSAVLQQRISIEPARAPATLDGAAPDAIAEESTRAPAASSLDAAAAESPRAAAEPRAALIAARHKGLFPI